MNRINTDNVQFVFSGDHNVVGRWEYEDYVRDVADFVPNSGSLIANPHLRGVEFLADGSMNVQFGTGTLAPSALRWTSGHVINRIEKTDSSYQVQVMNGEDYLFVEWKSGDYIFRDVTPEYYVFKRVTE